MTHITQPRYQRKITLTCDPDTEMGRSKTEQCHKDEVNIHHILRQYKKTGVIDHVNKHQGTYMDLADLPDYQEAQNIIQTAKSMFESVPAVIRADFDNDPAKYVDFMQKPENRAEIEAYGLDASHLPPQEETPLPPPQVPKDVTNPVSSPGETQTPTETP